MNIFYKYIKALDVLYTYIFKKYSPTSIVTTQLNPLCALENYTFSLFKQC